MAISKKALLKLGEEAEQHYKDGAVVLYKNSVSSVDANGLESYKYYIAIKILDSEAARDYSQMSTKFNSYYFERKIDFARVVKSNVEVKHLKDDAIIREHSGSNSKSIDDIQSINFALPNVKPGNIIELHSSMTQHSPLIEGHWFSNYRMNYVQFIESRNWIRIDPVMSSRLEITLPTEKFLKHKIKNMTAEPVITRDGEYTKLVLETGKLTGIEPEKRMPMLFNILPTVDITSMERWSVIDSWAADMFADKYDVTPDIASLAAQITQNTDTNLSKVQAVFEYVQNNVRYIGAHVNRGGFEPHKAYEVLEQGYGDCKDQSVLIIGLLKALNVKAYPVLISPDARDSVDPDFPELDFSHMITYVPGSDIWLDTSDMTGNFPGIYASLEGRTGLIIDGNGGQLKKIDTSDATENLVIAKLAFSLEEEKIQLNLSLKFSGHMDTLMRNIINNVPEPSDFIRQITAPFSTQEISNFEILNREDWSNPLEFNVQINEAGVLSEDMSRFSYMDTMMSLQSNFTEFATLEKPEDRIHDYVSQFGLKMVLQRDYPNIIDGGVLAIVQPATEFESENFQLKHSGDMDEESVRLTTSLLIKNKIIPKSAYATFYEEVLQIREHSSSTFIYVKDLKGIAQRKPINEDIEEQIQYVENLLDAGEFEEALLQTEKLISKFSNSGKAHYLHGVALGFNDRYSESELMFEKAESMGF